MMSASQVYSPASPTQAERPLVELDGVDLIEDDFGLESLGVLLETRHQIGTLNAVGIGRPVVDVGGRHELAALRETGDEHRAQVGARSVYCRGEPGGTGTEDQQARVLGRHEERSEGLLGSRSRSILTDVGIVPGRPSLLTPRRCLVYNVSPEICGPDS